MTAVVEPPQAELEVPAGSLRILGVVRSREQWERLEQVLYYYRNNHHSGIAFDALMLCMDAVHLHLSQEEWATAATQDFSTWLEALGPELDKGCTPYATADEMKVAARNHIIGARRSRDWCGEGTDSILGQLGLEHIEPMPYERQRFIALFQQIVCAHYGSDREAWIVRALLRGRPPAA